jgi:uncharacterized RDD family membrane protein YckC
MSTPTVTLQSITGVDVELRIAGPGSRSYAFVIDWHIRLLLALAWLFAGLALYTGRLMLLDGGMPRSGGFYLGVVVPAAMIYFLYHPVLEILMHGRTPGKRIAGVRLVSRTGDIPAPGALLVRNVFRLIDSMPFAYLVGLVCVMFTAQHVRVGDLAAGTLLVCDTTESDKSFGSLTAATGAGGLSPQAADLAQELLDRWGALDWATRADLARSLIARIDPSTSAQDLSSETPEQLRAHIETLLSGSQPA